jgi:signal transduction histidine kinase/ligand-binding sensor domain-containing protein
MRMTSIRLFLLAVLAFAGTGSALLCGQDRTRMQYFYSEAFGINEGLHHGVIADMRVDANGLLWLCTLGGLQVFDGMNFMDVPSLPGLPEPGFRFNADTSGDVFWINGRGLYRMPAGQYSPDAVQKLMLPPSGGEGDSVCMLAHETEEFLYVIHPNDTLYVIDKASLTIRDVRALPGPAMLMGRWSDIMVSPEPVRTIDYFVTDPVPAGMTAPTIPATRIMRLDLHTGDHRLLAGVVIGSRPLRAGGDTIVTLLGTELVVYTGGQRYGIDLPRPSKVFAGDFLCAAGRDAVRVLLDDGIYVFDLRRMEWTARWQTTGNLPASGVWQRKLVADRRGSLFISTLNAGFFRMYPGNPGFRYIGRTETGKNFIKCLRVSERYNRVLAGTIDNGLLMYDTAGNLQAHIRIFPDGKLHSFVSAILEITPSRYIIVSDALSEVTLEEGGYRIRMLDSPSPAEWMNYYDAIVEDYDQGRYFIHNSLGCVEFFPDRPVASQLRVFGRSGQVLAAIPDRGHYLRVGDRRMEWRDAEGRLVRAVDGLPDVGYCRSIVNAGEDRYILGANAGLFLITLRDGVARLDTLFDRLVYGILPGSAPGEFWFSTDFGLFRLGADRSLVNYSVETGLQENEFNTQSCYRTPSGKLYFGGVNGITAFYPDAVNHQVDVIVPMVRTISVNADIRGRYLLPDEQKVFTLSSADKLVRIELLGQGARSPGRYNYQYRIDGVHDEWVDLGRHADIQVQFRPGRHTVYYHVSGSFEPNAPLRHQVVLKVRPPVYARWWFVLGIGAAAALAVYSFFRLRARRKQMRIRYEQRLDQQLQDERMRISRELHDNIGAQMATVKRNLNFLINHKDRLTEGEVTRKMADLEGISTQINQELRDTIWVTQHAHIPMADFIARIKAYVFQVVGPESPCRVYYEERCTPDVELGPFVALNLHRICQEAINNIIKHAHASEIRITFADAAGGIGVTITDNGNGFDADAPREGYGLSNIRQRAALIGAEIHFNRNITRGSRLEVFLRHPKAPHEHDNHEPDKFGIG